MVLITVIETATALLHLLYGALGLFAAYYISTAVYCIYFHPLRNIPGPKFAAFSKLPFAKSLVTGTFHNDIKKLHEQYGEVIRFTPNHISFTSADAWRDIYNYRRGEPYCGKDKMNYITPVNGVENIHSTPDEASHQRQRRLLSHAFSEKALIEQEPMILSYIDLLIKRLRETLDGPTRGKVDLVRWLNWTTFDLVGDLTFGEPFLCLEHSDFHPWIAIVFDSMRAAIFMVASKQFPLADKLLSMLIPKAVRQKMLDHHNMSAEKMDRRLASETQRPDFVYYLTQKDTATDFNLEEMHSNSTLIILAGSETGATALSGAIYHLSKNPDKFQKLVHEIRSSVRSESELTLTTLAGMKYLNAVLEESMRIYPPVAGYLPRTAPPEGITIAGTYVPPGTQLSVTPWAITHSSANFKNPDTFVPERWIGDGGIYASDKRHASQPFSVGPRNCIGKNLAWAEMRSILAKLLWNFDIEVCPESLNWVEQKTFILWQKPPLYLQLTPRKVTNFIS